ncbi:MAG TPA: alkaline phosphatase family protein [Thermoanaerobaculia bacterium]|nr:alkaline phosphatase family protein [Thermoanaerobaculia bacterium]
MRKLLIAVVVVGAVAYAALAVRVQPAGAATVFRSASNVVARTTRVYVRARGTACRVPLAGDRLAYAGDAPNADFTTHVRFAYSLPASLPRDWPGGDWCTSLSALVNAAAQRLQFSAGDLLDHRHEAGDRIAASIAQTLRPVDARDVTARVDLPMGFERLRAIAEVAARAHAARPVIFIGLDGADWNLLDGYMASAAMPNLRKLVATGTRAAPETEMPPLSPIVWTTMVTGTSPLQHQILDFTRFNPYTHEKEPITSDERRVAAIWNMLTYAGKSCAVFGLWATYAAEPVHGVNVSDRLFSFLYTGTERPVGVVYPPLRQRWAEQHVADAERSIDLPRMREFLPSLTESEFAALSQPKDPYAQPASALWRMLIETEIYRRLSLDYLRSSTRIPDLTIVYFQGTDTIGHEYAPFLPPKQPQVTQSDFDHYSGVPEKYFRYIDTILGEYAEIASHAGGQIVIASDHGFRWIEGRPTQISSTATATAAKWHRHQGIFVSTTPTKPPKGIRDINHVLLSLTGTPEIDYSRYFQRAIPPPLPVSKRATDAELAKLRALGYIGSNEATRSAVPQNDTKTGGAYNNAGLILRNDHRIDEAIASFEHALAIDPRYASAMWNLSETLFEAGRDFDRADALLVSALQNGLADATRFVIVRSIAYERSSRSDRALRLLEKAVTVAGFDAELRMFRGRYRMDRRDCRGALDDFTMAEQQQPGNALAFASAGLAQMCLGESAAAEASLAHARQLDPSLQLPR